MYYNYNSYKFRSDVFLFHKNLPFLNIDLFWLKIFSFSFANKKYKTNTFRSYFRVLNTKQGFYFNFKNLENKNNSYVMMKNSFLSGLKYIWLGLRF